MARISTYPIISTPTVDDLLIGTDVNDLNITKNFTIGEIGQLIGQDYVPYVGATGNVNLGSFNITASSFIVPGGLASQFVKADGSLDSTAYTPQTRTLTINGTTYNLSANRSWDLNTLDSLTTIGTSGAATYIGKVLNIPVYQAQGAYITQLSGEATAVGPGNATVTLSNSAVISKVLTGLNVTGGTVLSTDTILQAFGKVQNQINGLAGGVEYQGTWNAATNNPFLQSSVGVQGHYYVVNVAGNTNLNGITDWQVGDWAIYNGSAWEKVDNTDAVVSVNGYVGAVVLTSSDVGAVPTTRTLTINGVGYNLSADRSWTVGDVRTDQSYTNPSWIASLAWSKITGTPTTLAGYGITDGALNTRTLTINGTTYDLTANRTWNVGTVTSVGTSGPLTGGTITGSGTIGITQAGASSDGYLSSADWNAFNSKQEVISVTAPITFAAGVIGITQSGASSNGYLSSTDWTTFNSKVSGSGTANTLPMWGTASSLINSPLSYASDTFNFQYNSATGGTVNFTNIGLTSYTYSIQMNNFGSPRSTVHSYTDGLIIQSIGGTQVSRMFANGNLILGTGTVDNGYKLEITGNLYVNTIANAITDTDKFLVSDGGVIKYRTGAEILSDIGAQGALTLTTTGTSGPATLISNTLNIPNYGSALTGYVPYSGATQDLDLGTYGLISDFVRFNPSSSNIPSAEGVMSWDNTDGTVRLSVKGNTYSVPIGQSVISRVRNNTGTNLLRTNYQVVKVAGAQGQRLAVTLAQANNDANSASTLGLVCENISNNQEGFIVNIGQVTSINTTGNLQGETWNDGDVLYLSPTIAGAITNIKPTAPQHTVILGYVEYAHANNGKIYVKIDNGYELEELHDVSAEPFINNGLLYRDTTLNLWKSATISTILGYTPAPQGNYITALTGEVTASGPGSVAATLSNSAVTGKVLTGLNITGNAIVSTDSILTAFGKLQHQVNQLVGGLQYEGTWNASTNTPTITSSVGTDGTFYIVSVAGTTNINGINDWQVGDWIVFHDTSWQKVDNSDSVSSVFGRVGNIVANQSDYSAFYPLIADIKNGILTVQGTGVLSGSGTFSANQATNNTITLTHAAVSRTDTTSTQTPSFGGSFTVVDSVTSSAEGHVTAINTKTVTVPSTIATSTITGLLSNTDWVIFNSKQNALTNPVTGTGTTNVVPKFTGTSTIGDSSISDNTNEVSITKRLFLNTGGQSILLTPNLGGSVNRIESSNLPLEIITLGSSLRLAAGGTTPQFTLASSGATTLSNLAGTGTRMVVADSSGVLSTQAIGSGSITGTGTTNYLPKFTGSTTIGNSLTSDDGTNVTINGTSSTTKLKIVSPLSSSLFQSGVEFIRTTVSGGSKIEALRDTVNGGVGLSFQVTANNTAEVNGTYTSAMTVLNSGNIGIGTTNPLTKLQITQALDGSYPTLGVGKGALFIAGDTNLYGLYVGVNTTDGNAWMQAMRNNTATAYNLILQPSGGNLLVGTTTDNGARLQVSGAATVSGDLTANRYRGINSLILNSYTTVNPSSNVYLYSPPNDRDAWIYLDSADTGSNWGIYHRQIDSAVAGLPGNSIGFIGGGTSSLQSYINILNGDAYFRGNVGIGTTSPAQKLEVNGRVRVTPDGINGGDMAVDAGGLAFSTIGASPITFQRSNFSAESMRIAAGGNVLIGNTSAYTSRLTVQAAAANRPAIKAGFGVVSGNGYWVLGDNYTLDESLTSYGIDYSSGDLVLGSIVAPSTTTSGAFISTQAQFGNLGSAIRAGNSGDIYFFRGTSTSVVSIGGAKSMTESMRINSSGNLLIGTNADNGAKLNVNGTIRSNDTNGLGLGSIAGYRRIQYGSDNATSFTLLTDGNGYAGLYAGSATFSGNVIVSGFLGTTDRLYIPGNRPISDWFSSSFTAGYSQANSYGWVNGATNLVLGTNGIERIRIISSGNVGIGTTSPTYRLQIGNSGGLADSIRIGDYQVSPNTRQYIGYARFDSGLFESSGSGDTPSTVLPGVAGIRIVNTAGTITPSQADNSIQLLTHIYNGNSRIVLHANFDGNVGMGTTSPNARLHVEGGKGLVRTTDSGWGQFAVANPNDAEVGITWGAGGTGYPGATSTYTRQWIAGLSPFGTGTDRWSLTNSLLGANTAITVRDIGNVGIGTTNPGVKLVNSGAPLATSPTLGSGTIGANAILSANGLYGLYTGVSSAGHVWQQVQRNDGGGSVYPLVLQPSGGNVLIGTLTDAGYTLNVVGNAQFIKSTTSTAMVVGLSGVTGSIIRFSYNGGFVGSISTDGSNTAYNTSSDYRLKQDIKDFNGLDLLSKIKTYDFEWKSDKTRSYGVLAHELQEVIDYAVHGGKDEEEMQGVDYSKLVPIMVKAIQEQQAQIQELKNKLS